MAYITTATLIDVPSFDELALPRYNSRFIVLGATILGSMLAAAGLVVAAIAVVCMTLDTSTTVPDLRAQRPTTATRSLTASAYDPTGTGVASLVPAPSSQDHELASRESAPPQSISQQPASHESTSIASIAVKPPSLIGTPGAHSGPLVTSTPEIAPAENATSTPVVASLPHATMTPEPVIAPLPPAIPRPGDVASQSTTAPFTVASLPPTADVGNIVPLPPRRPLRFLEHEPAATPNATAPTVVTPPESNRDAIPQAPREANPEPPRVAPAPAAPVVASNPPQQDNRNIFQRIFGALSGPSTSSGGTPGNRTAIYDISAHTVYMPDGERLEAHSGLGSNFDDPHSISEKNRGVTPPNVYDLTLRGELFHGVAALRMTPVGEGNMFGRNGILAHSYMLGARGESNGCVSFRDYQKFLRAFRSGEVSRLLVVAHHGDTASFASNNR